MAEDSQREQIIEAIKGKMLQLQWPMAVRRGRTSFDKLKTIAQTQFPFISISGLLPSGEPALASRRSDRAVYLKFVSTLRVEIITYDFIYDDQLYDRLISNRFDDMWKKIYEDPSFGGLCQSCIIEPEPVIGVWSPYLAFKLTVAVTYNHGIGGI